MVNQIFYILRHGQTLWNLNSDRHQTHSNGVGNRLTEVGLDQADRAGTILKDEVISVAYHSPLERSKQTLDRVLVYHPSVKLVEDSCITEMSMAFLDGMTQEEWESQFLETKALYEARSLDKYGCQLPDGIDYARCLDKAVEIAQANGEADKEIPPWENYADVVARTKEFISNTSRHHDSPILISAHQGSIRALLGNLLLESSHLRDIRDIANLNTPNAVIFRIETYQSGIDLYHNLGEGWTQGLVS